ncbi:MAG TPA: hypothetical protein VH436_17225 [Vicinamibacterales bacterium]|jgi:hypothetical protein
MYAAVNRRVFVASVAAGIPTLAGAAYGPRALAHGGRDHAPTGGKADAVLDHVVRELAVIHSRGKQRGFTGEDARAIAAQLRMAAVRGAQIDLDATARAEMEQLIRRRGREAVLAIDIDKAKTTAHLKRYGIEVDDRSFAMELPDPATRRKALEVLISGGVTDVLTHTAGVFEQTGSVIDAHAATVMRARHAQGDPLAWASFCWGLLTEVMVLMAQLGPICEASGTVPGLDIVCSALQATLSAYFGIYYAYCA